MYKSTFFFSLVLDVLDVWRSQNCVYSKREEKVKKRDRVGEGEGAVMEEKRKVKKRKGKESRKKTG